MVMPERTLSATQFKARCLALLDDVAATRRPLVVTKHGRPVARVVAIDDEPSLQGSVRFLVDDDELVEPLEPWDAEDR
jgi:prevent-host-death family protein